MIAKLRGLLESYGTDWVVIDVNGVGYLATCSRQTLKELPELGAPFSLYTETYLKNEQVHLCGFYTPQERSSFRLLTTVQGVGARVALALLSILTPDQLAHAIYTQDKTALGRAEGVGPKLASRILMELKDKIGKNTEDLEKVIPLPSSSHPLTQKNLEEDALSALVNLGYKAFEARQAVTGVLQQEKADLISLDDVIRQSLKTLLSGQRSQGDNR